MEFSTYNVIVVLDEKYKYFAESEVAKINRVLKSDVFDIEAYLRAMLINALDVELEKKL